jgi:phosphatidylinositol-3-phosphatase
MSARRQLIAGGALVTAVAIVAVVIFQSLGGGSAPATASGPAIVPGTASASATVTTATPSGGAGSSPAPGASAGAMGVKRIWMIVMENRSYSQVIGSSHAPFLNGLAAAGGLATDYHGVAHPSEPNYLALVSGSMQGVTDDGTHSISAPTLMDQLDSAEKSWSVYAENVPLGCFTGASASGGPDGSGTYARKHEPAISFTAVSRDPQRCARITNLSHFTPGGADFSLIIPNLCHDMHDCSTRTGDDWLRSFVPKITGSAAFADGGLLLIVFDEGEGGGNQTALVFSGPTVAPGTKVTARADHYGLLRTIQEAFGLDCLAKSCGAAPLGALLGPGSP